MRDGREKLDHLRKEEAKGEVKCMVMYVRYVVNESPNTPPLASCFWEHILYFMCQYNGGVSVTVH